MAREVTDKDHITRSYVQALAGVEGKTAEKAAKLVNSKKAKVSVVCTPNGKAQSVRLELSSDWEKQTSDEELLNLIATASTKE